MHLVCTLCRHIQRTHESTLWADNSIKTESSSVHDLDMMLRRDLSLDMMLWRDLSLDMMLWRDLSLDMMLWRDLSLDMMLWRDLSITDRASAVVRKCYYNIWHLRHSQLTYSWGPAWRSICCLELINATRCTWTRLLWLYVGYKRWSTWRHTLSLVVRISAT